MRIVFDTNVLVSALVFNSTNARNVLQLAIREHIVLFSSPTFSELSATLLSSKFSGIINIETIIRFLHNLKKAGIFITPSESILACRDPKDNKFLELAIAGKAACIVTGDKDLLILNPFRNIRIITSKEFLSQF